MRQWSRSVAPRDPVRGRASRRCATARRTGFSIIELMVAIAIIGLLISLLVPAVQTARESARRMECLSHLTQIAIAFHGHQNTHSRFPSNGWGFRWIGDPDRGTDSRQPGGWIYNVLPFLEAGPVRQQGRGIPPGEKRVELAQVMATPLSVFDCPSRPSDMLSEGTLLYPPFNADATSVVAKTDYAVNEGDFISDTGPGPPTLSDGDDPAWPWLDTSFVTGVCFQRSEISMAAVTDGTSNTYLVGEKYVSSEYYESAGDPGHDQSMYSGVDVDINRWVIDPPQPDGAAVDDRIFGSAHTGFCNFVFCDGSARSVNFTIDSELHRRLGNRHDGLPAEQNF